MIQVSTLKLFFFSEGFFNCEGSFADRVISSRGEISHATAKNTIISSNFLVWKFYE